MSTLGERALSAAAAAGGRQGVTKKIEHWYEGERAVELAAHRDEATAAFEKLAGEAPQNLYFDSRKFVRIEHDGLSFRYNPTQKRLMLEMPTSVEYPGWWRWYTINTLVGLGKVVLTRQERLKALRDLEAAR